MRIAVILSLFFQGRFDPLSLHLPRNDADYLSKRVAAIEDTSGRFLGSGFFVSLDERPRWVYLATNFHVAGRSGRVIAFVNGHSYTVRPFVKDSIADIVIMTIDVRQRNASDSFGDPDSPASETSPPSFSLPATVQRSRFILDRSLLWPGMFTVLSGYPFGAGLDYPYSPSLSFGRISRMDGQDSMIRIEGILDLGSSGSPVFTWVSSDAGERVRLLGMARSFQVARCLSSQAGDTLVVQSGLYEIVPAWLIYKVLLKADSTVMAFISKRNEEE